MMTIRTVMMGLVAALALTGAGRAADTPAGVQKTYKVVVDNAATIMKWAYPTVTYDRISKATFDGMTTGYNLSCRFEYTDSDGDKEYRVLTFVLNNGGAITSIRDGGGPSIWAPFTGLKFAKELLAKAAEEQAKNETDANKKQVLELLAGSPEPEQVLALILNLKR